MARTPNIALENLDDTELRELIQHARQTLGERIRKRMDEFRALALEAGYSVTFTRLGEEGRGGRRRRGAEADEFRDRRGNVQAKYRNPDNFTEVWSGRGREPKWLQDKLKAGKKKEEFLISPAGGEGSAVEETEEKAAAEA